jgi:hypothetical protein
MTGDGPKEHVAYEYFPFIFSFAEMIDPVE